MASVVQNVFVPQDPRDEWLILDPQDDTSQKDLPQLVDVVIIGSRIATISPSEKNQTSTDLAQHALQVVLSDVTVKNSEHYLKVLTESFGVDHNHITALSDDATAPRDSRKVPDGLHSRAGAESGAISFDGIQLRLLEVTNCSAGRWLLPGWIDMQVNDLAWMARWEKELFAIDEHVRRILDLLSYQGGDGVTGLCIATVAAPVEHLTAYLEAMKRVMDMQHKLPHACRDVENVSSLHGAVVEGTFMNPQCHGCHNPKYVLQPNAEVLDKLLNTGAVKTINIAPEMGEEKETLELIRRTASSPGGVLVAAGHCKPHAEMLRKAINAGCSYIIHLGNGMPGGGSFKAACNGGLMEESLRNDDVVATVIVDNHHVHPALVRDWTVRKQLHRIVAVSDVAFGLGLPPGDTFEVFGRQGKASKDKTCLMQADTSGAGVANRSSDSISGLFGSNARMSEIFKNIVNLFTSPLVGVYCRRHPALSLAKAVSIASAICSSNPGRLLGKELSIGKIKPGYVADMVLVKLSDSDGLKCDSDGLKCESPTEAHPEEILPSSRYQLRVLRTWCGGRCVRSTSDFDEHL